MKEVVYLWACSTEMHYQVSFYRTIRKNQSLRDTIPCLKMGFCKSLRKPSRLKYTFCVQVLEILCGFQKAIWVPCWDISKPNLSLPFHMDGQRYHCTIWQYHEHLCAMLMWASCTLLLLVKHLCKWITTSHSMTRANWFCSSNALHGVSKNNSHKWWKPILTSAWLL